MNEEWLERWHEGRIGWHEEGGNASLKQHWRASGCRVLVPMCGKTPDLVWLAEQDNEVVGVELSRVAVEAFFDEQGLRCDVEDADIPVYRARELPIAIYCGDLFELHDLACNAHYDRGALVATAADRRPAYAQHVNRLLEPMPEQLIIVLEYDDTVAKGPPFSVPADEVLGYWPELVCVEAYDDIANGPPKFIEAGLQEMTEIVWRSP
jgi:thiopurine S-methyltransferase